MQIREVMQRYGFTPTTLAKKMGVYDSTISRLIAGNPTVEKLEELAKNIGCSRWEFFEDEIRASGMELHQDGVNKEQTATPATEASGAERRGADNADGLPFTDGAERQPTATRQEALVCPHCRHAMVITIDTYEQ